MKPVEHEKCNVTLKGGDKANDLKVQLVHDSEGNYPYLVAKFEFTEEEIERIIKEKSINIAIMGTSFPPIMPSVESPEELGFIDPLGPMPKLMKFRKPIGDMLKSIYFDPSWMSEVFWNQFVEKMHENFDFIKLGNQFEFHLINGVSLEHQLDSFKKTVLEIMSVDQMKNFI